MGDVLRLSGVAVDPDGGGAVADLDLSIAPGEIVGLVGDLAVVRTVGRLAAGVLEPAAGTVTVDGIPAAGRNPAALRRAIYLDEVGFRWVARATMAALYPGWDEDRYRGLCERWKLGRFARKQWAPTARYLATFGLASGAPLVVVVPDRWFRTSWDAEALADVVAAAREVGCALLVGDPDAAILEGQVDRLVSVERGRSVKASAPARVAPAEPGEEARLIRPGLRPTPQTWLELAALGALCWLLSGIEKDFVRDVVLPHALIGLWLPIWLTGWWSPVSALGDGQHGAWGARGDQLPASRGALVRARGVIAAARSLPPLLVLLWAAQSASLSGLLEGISWSGNSVVVLCLLLFVLGTPLAASAGLVAARRLRWSVLGLGFGLTWMVSWLALRDAWLAPRLWQVAMTSAPSLLFLAAAWALATAWVAVGLPRRILGNARGRRSWSPAVVAVALGVMLGAPLVLRVSMPEPDWRDIKVPAEKIVDDRTVLVRSDEPPPGVPSTVLVDVTTWEVTPLAPGVVGLARAGEGWGRLVSDGSERWMEYAATRQGPPMVRSGRWPEAEGQVWWSTTTEVLVGSERYARTHWLDPSGETGVLEIPDGRPGAWRLTRDEDGVVRLVPRPKVACADGSKPGRSYGSVFTCGPDDARTFHWDDDRDRSTAARLIPTPPVLPRHPTGLRPNGDGRFVVHDESGGSWVLTLDGEAWTSVQRLDVEAGVLLSSWMGPDRLLIRRYGGRAGENLVVCDATTGACETAPLR